jgi:iron complex transport system permease protein
MTELHERFLPVVTSPATGFRCMTMSASPEAMPEGRGFYRALVLRRQLLLAAVVVRWPQPLRRPRARAANYTLSEVCSGAASVAVDDQIRVILWEIRMPVALMACSGREPVGRGRADADDPVEPAGEPLHAGISRARASGQRWRSPSGSCSSRPRWTT